mgnify:FL=1
MELSKLSYVELLTLKRQVDVELLFKKETKVETKKLLKIYAIELVNYIKSNTGVDISQKNRKHLYVFSRYVVSKHLYEKGMLLSEIGNVFNLDHTSIIHGNNTYAELLETEFETFMAVKGKIDKLIKDFNDKETTKADTGNVQAECGEVA